MLVNLRNVRLLILLVLFFSGFLFDSTGYATDIVPIGHTLKSSSANLLLKDQVSVERLELSSEAFAVWRQYSTRKPTLLLLSNDPLLQRFPKSLSEKVTQVVNPTSGEVDTLDDAPILELVSNPLGREVSRLIDSASREELRRATNYGHSSPLFLPTMTIDIALRKGWFQKFSWVFPSDVNQSMNLDALYEQFEKSGFLNQEELSSLTVKDQVAQGLLRGVPMTMTNLANLEAMSGPVLLHIDQSYFQALYKNEIATPLLQLVSETLSALSDKNLEILAVTYSLGNLDSRVSLQVRFLQEIIPAMIVNPSLLEQPWPLNWQRQEQILYLDNFFRKEETRKLALDMEAEDPASAWVKFTLYLSSVEHKQGAGALAFLSEAVALDKVYALEYLRLSEMAYGKGRPDEAMRMLGLAAESFPENLQIKLNMARIASDMGEFDAAMHLVEQLQGYQWSPLYYAAMPEYLRGFTDFLAQTKASGSGQTSETPTAADPRRQRILK